MIYVGFEADNEIDSSTKGNKTTIFCEQKPVLNGHHIISDLDDVLSSG